MWACVSIVYMHRIHICMHQPTKKGIFRVSLVLCKQGYKNLAILVNMKLKNEFWTNLGKLNCWGSWYPTFLTGCRRWLVHHLFVVMPTHHLIYGYIMMRKMYYLFYLALVFLGLMDCKNEIPFLWFIIIIMSYYKTKKIIWYFYFYMIY